MVSDILAAREQEPLDARIAPPGNCHHFQDTILMRLPEWSAIAVSEVAALAVADRGGRYDRQVRQEKGLRGMRCR
jgi:hypothetical protein